VVARVLAAGVASLVVIALAGVTLYLSERPFRAIPAWTVTKATSANYTMVVDVDASRMDQARTIAEAIVAPVRARGYQEVLVYVHPLGKHDQTTEIRRVQWTPRGGFVETDY
jgi:hypothetical protein